jgi:hypothetical protein
MTRLRLNPIAYAGWLLERRDMRLLGTQRTARIARAYNARRNAPFLEHRRDNAGRHRAFLEDARDGDTPRVEMRDGFAFDRSGSLAHLDRLLAEMGEVIEARGDRPFPAYGRPFLQDILHEDEVESYPSILDFGTSPEVLEPLLRYVGWLPCLARATPPGVRVMRSSTRFDPNPGAPWRSSQLWHIDYHSSPTIYMIVALREITPADGPLRFLGAAASRSAADALAYGSRRTPHRITDEQMDEIVDPDEVQTFCGPPGTVLFIDSSRCFHFGSRKPANDRFQMQYAYVSPVLNDFGDVLRPHYVYSDGPDDPPHRRLVLDRTFISR